MNIWFESGIFLTVFVGTMWILDAFSYVALMIAAVISVLVGLVIKMKMVAKRTACMAKAQLSKRRLMIFFGS